MTTYLERIRLASMPYPSNWGLIYGRVAGPASAVTMHPATWSAIAGEVGADLYITIAPGWSYRIMGLPVHLTPELPVGALVFG